MAEAADTHSQNPAVRRVVEEVIGAEAADALGERLAGSDLTSLLLEVMKRRAALRSPREIARQYERDRFTQPAGVDARALMAMGARAVDAIGSGFELVETSPLVPLGTHSVIAGISQNRVVSTVRSTEVAADPTNSLALEAAARRQTLLRDDPRSAVVVRLASIDRVTRAQQFDGPRSFAHFTLLGLVSAGRDVGNRGFERDALLDHLRALIAVCRVAGFPRLSVQLTDPDGDLGAIVDTVRDAVSSDAESSGESSGDVSVTAWPERTAGRDYYRSLCFKLSVVDGDETIEVADGGVVDWTQSLLGNRKERLMISGISVERLALVRSPNLT